MIAVMALVSVLFLFNATAANAAPKFSRGVSVSGVVAYQDDQNATQFHYLPTRADVVLGDRITTFKATHFGVGSVYYVQTSSGDIKSMAGALLSGTVAIDISAEQRKALINEINTRFGVAAPALLPLQVSNVNLKSILLDEVIGFGDKVQQHWPTNVSLASEFPFSIGSLNSGFAHIVAGLQAGVSVMPNPHFSLSVEGQAEFAGDPWTADIDCDLSQVWNQVRKRFSTSVSLGWFRVGGAEVNQVFSDLQKSGECKWTMNEGSLDTEKYGRQILETAKQLFDQINKSSVSGEGFFKFEPNPEAPPPGGGSGGGFGLFGWSISVNGGYSTSHFTQSIKYKNKFSYTGRFRWPVAVGAVLAVDCNSATADHFQDLSDASQPCITQAKLDTFKIRVAKEVKAKNAKLLSIEEKLIAKEITPEIYDRLFKLYNSMSFAEDMANVGSNALVGIVELNSVDAMGPHPMFNFKPGVALEGPNNTPKAFTPISLDHLEKLENEIINSK